MFQGLRHTIEFKFIYCYFIDLLHYSNTIIIIFCILLLIKLLLLMIRNRNESISSNSSIWRGCSAASLQCMWEREFFKWEWSNERRIDMECERSQKKSNLMSKIYKQREKKRYREWEWEECVGGPRTKTQEKEWGRERERKR